MKATPQREVFSFILIGGREAGRRWRPTTKRAQGGQGARTGSMLGPGTADRPSPFRRAPSAPLPHCSLPHATPTRRTTRLGVPAAPHPRTLPLPGDSGTRPTPVPRLPVAAALLLSEAGTCTPPLPGGAEFTTYFPTPSRGRGRASFSSDRRGGETQCHLANCPSYRFLGSQGRHWRHYLQQAGGGEGRGPKLS